MEHDDQSIVSERIAVPSEYERIFTHFYIARNNSPEAISKTLLPAFQTIMVFSFGVPVQLQSDSDIRIDIEKCIVLGPV